MERRKIPTSTFRTPAPGEEISSCLISNSYDLGAADLSLLQFQEGLIGLFQAVFLVFGLNGDLGGQRQNSAISSLATLATLLISFSSQRSGHNRGLTGLAGHGLFADA